MNPTLRAARLGLSRGWIEFKQSLRNSQDISWNIGVAVIILAVLWWQRGSEVNGVSLALLTLPSLLGMGIANGGFVGAAGTLSYDREDGTLLRAKAVPQGMVGYLFSRLVTITLTTLMSFIIILPAVFFIDGLTIDGFGVVTLIWIFFLGLLATAPWGAIVGSLVKNSTSGWGLTFMPMVALVAISGIFYPITALAGWIQFIAQLFPVYWLGLGARSIFLPDSAAANELGGSWQLPIVALVLTAWAIVGTIIALRVMKRMARRESGSNVEKRRQEVMQRGY